MDTRALQPSVGWMTKDLVQQFEDIEKILTLKAKGQSDTAIAKQLGTTRAKVLETMESYQKFISQDSDIKARAQELLIQIDHHYDMLVQKAWYVIDEAELTNDLKIMNDAIKTAAGLAKDRQQLYQAAGLNADDDLASELARMEEEHEAIKNILKTVVGKCPNCRGPVMSEIARLNGEPAEVVILHDESA